MGKIEAICIGREMGQIKTSIPEAELRFDHGIVGDAHANHWHRQVSILPRESLDLIRERVPSLEDGAFEENLILSGIDFTGVDVGDWLRLGRYIVLEVTQIGKTCHADCATRSLVGDCILPKEGIFCRVISGGRVTPGEEVSLYSADFELNHSPLAGVEA